MDENNIVWEPEDYDPGISVEQWIELLNDKSVFNEKCRILMKRMKDSGGQASCTQLKEKYGRTPAFYNGVSVGLGKRIAEKVNILPCPRKSYQWVSILYLQHQDKTGYWIWKLRRELLQALGEVDLSDVPLYEEFPTDEAQIHVSPKMDLPDLKRAARHYGREHPVATESTVRQYKRSESVKNYAKARANGYCQLYGNKAPFSDAEGNPYLEVHHIVRLADGGPDTIENAVALCPNCHRKMHVVNNPNDVEHLKSKCSK